MKKTLKEEMLEAIEDTHKFMSANCLTGHLATSCTSIAEKHIKIARLEGMIEVYNEWYNSVDWKIARAKLIMLQDELKELKKQ